MPETNARIKVCHDTAANFKTNNPTLLVGEWALETDTKKMKIGDGSTAYNALPYSTAEDSEEWRKPADWIDIRSGALPNSIYFLVGHSADYTTYPEFSVQATVSNSGTYDVYVDGIKQATTASGTVTTLNWQTLALASGYDVTYPVVLKTHVVRVTPTSSSNTITAIKANDQTSQNGLLWAHFSLQNTLSLLQAFGQATRSICPILEVVTSQNGVIKTNVLNHAFAHCDSLVEIPTIDFDNGNISFYRAFYACAKLKNLYFRNGRIQASTSSTGTGQFAFFDCRVLKKIKTENCTFYNSDNFFGLNHALERLPNFVADSTCWPTLSIRNQRSLKDTFLDLSSYSNAKKVNISGESANPALGWKGITVSNEAPFDDTTSPQLDVSYTGLSRAALINLFKSMPYNVAYEKVGNPTIVNGVLLPSDKTTNTDYIKIVGNINLNNDYEIQYKFKLSSGAKSAIYPFSLQNTSAGYIDINYNPGLSGKPIQFLVYPAEASWHVLTSTNFTFEEEVDYWIRIVKNSNNYKLYISTDGLEFALNNEVTFSDLPSNLPTINQLNIGYSTASNRVLLGSIDFNQTYIKVNDAPFFGPGATKNLVPGGTVVGSPTITNGVASGFDSSSYITIPYVGTTLPQECVFTFTTGSDITSTQTVFNNYSCRVQISSGVIKCFMRLGKDLGITKTSSGISVNTKYTVKISMTSSGVGMYYKTADSDYVTIYEGSEVVVPVNSKVYIGHYDLTTQSFLGSIDLNSTYIKVGSNYVYRGMVPQVKTCSVVGCTGTADLTADDKAIATGKGWELTVA